MLSSSAGTCACSAHSSAPGTLATTVCKQHQRHQDKLQQYTYQLLRFPTQLGWLHLARFHADSPHVNRLELEGSDGTDAQTESHPSCLHPSQFKLTTIDSFWKSVETSAATGNPLPATANHTNSLQPDEPHLQELSNTIITLPRITTMIRPVTKHYKRDVANHVWADTAAWSRDLLLEMLERFLAITGAKTIPHIAEYKILPDKVKSLINMMKIAQPPACCVTSQQCHAECAFGLSAGDVPLSNCCLHGPALKFKYGL